MSRQETFEIIKINKFMMGCIANIVSLSSVLSSTGLVNWATREVNETFMRIVYLIPAIPNVN